MERRIDQIVTELEEHHNDSDSQKPISESTFHACPALQKVLDYTIDELSSKNLSISSSLIPSITSAMESGGPQNTLSSLPRFTPNSNVLSLFTPHGVALLRIVHRRKNKGKSVEVGDDEILSDLLKSEHGDNFITAAEILRCLSSSIIMSKSQARIFGLAFVYLLCKAPERAELRALAVESILEIETSIQEECENLFLELVLDRITRAGSNADFLERNHHEVLSLLKEICHGEVTPWVKKICTNLGKKSKLKPKVAISLQNIIRKSESMWLAESKPIEKCPSEVEEEEASVDWAGNRVSLLQTISNVSVELPAEPAADLAHNLHKRIEEFNMHSMELLKVWIAGFSKSCKVEGLD
ncbi:condensin-2 complex subunit D3 [Tanacetum coccineum]